MILTGYYLCQKTLLKFNKTGGGAIFGAVGPAIRRYVYIVKLRKPRLMNKLASAFFIGGFETNCNTLVI